MEDVLRRQRGPCALAIFIQDDPISMHLPFFIQDGRISTPQACIVDAYDFDVDFCDRRSYFLFLKLGRLVRIKCIKRDMSQNVANDTTP